MLEDVLDFLGGQAGINCDYHATGQRNGELREKGFVAIGRQNADPIVFLQPVVEQCMRKSLRIGGHFGEGNATRAVDETNFVRVNTGAAL